MFKELYVLTRKSARKLVKLVYVAVFFAGTSLALAHIDRSTAISAFFAFSAAHIILITTVLLSGTILAGLRLFYIAADGGQQLTFGEALSAFSVGQIGNLVGAQMVGQIAARSLYLGRRGVSTSENIAMVGYERLAAFMVSAAFAAFGAIYLFGRITIELTAGETDLIQTIGGITAAVTGAAALGWGSRAVNFLQATISRLDGRSVLRIIALTVLIHATTASAFCIAVDAITPGISLVPLIAACGIIMFVSSLPISFSGWGVRELSAVFVLKTIGVPTSNAFTVAIMVGILSLASVILFALASPMITSNKRLMAAETRGNSMIATAITAALPLAIATLVCVQIYMPTANGYINLNVADPLAVLAAMIFLPRLFSSRTVELPYHFFVVLIACGIAIFIGLLIGVYQFGWTQWAYLNRGVGYLVLVSYAFGGALLGTQADKGLRLTCLSAFIGAVIAVGGFDLIRLGILLCKCTAWHVPLGGLQGLSHDRNAFAFLLVLTFAALPMVDSVRLRSALLVILALFIFLTGSKAGWVTSITLVLGLLYFRTIRWQDVGFAIAAIVLAYMIINHSQTDFSGVVAIGRNESLNQHIKSVFDGLRMFVAHPFFGAGVGAYYLQQKGQLLIHSSPVWILAETGLFGFLAFGTLGLLVIRDANTLVDHERHCVLLLLLAFGMMSLPHDMLYQRAIWFLVSLLLYGRSPPRSGLDLTAIPVDDQVQSIGRLRGEVGQAPIRYL
jgi:uncharacterized membrane protein YbhN (UPF0104 family)